MNAFRARGLAEQARSNIGRCLQLSYKIKHTPATDVPPVTKTAIRANLIDNKLLLKRLYQEHPEIKPEKVKQLSLFSKET